MWLKFLVGTFLLIWGAKFLAHFSISVIDRFEGKWRLQFLAESSIESELACFRYQIPETSFSSRSTLTHVPTVPMIISQLVVLFMLIDSWKLLFSSGFSLYLRSASRTYLCSLRDSVSHATNSCRWVLRRRRRKENSRPTSNEKINIDKLLWCE